MFILKHFFRRISILAIHEAHAWLTQLSCSGILTAGSPQKAAAFWQCLRQALLRSEGSSWDEGGWKTVNGKKGSQWKC